jgi:hypothetical protein
MPATIPTIRPGARPRWAPSSRRTARCLHPSTPTTAPDRADLVGGIGAGPGSDLADPVPDRAGPDLVDLVDLVLADVAGSRAALA